MVQREGAKKSEQNKKRKASEMVGESTIGRGRERERERGREREGERERESDKPRDKRDKSREWESLLCWVHPELCGVMRV